MNFKLFCFDCVSGVDSGEEGEDEDGRELGPKVCRNVAVEKVRVQQIGENAFWRFEKRLKRLKKAKKV